MKFLKFLIVISGVILFQSCAENTAKEREENPEGIRTELKPTEVKTAVVEKKNFVNQIETSGKVIPLHKQLFLAEAGGQLKVFNGANGRVYNEGEVIAQFDRSMLALELERAKLNEYNTGLEYKSELLGFSKGNEIQVSDSVRRKIEASSGYGAAKIDLQKAEQAWRKATIIAPFSGKIASVNVQSGSWVKSGDELFTLYSHTDLLAEVNVLETDIHYIRIGQLASVIPLAGSANPVTATVEEINPLVDEHGQVTVKLRIQKPQGLLPGMNVRTVIEVLQHTALVVPKEAVVIRSNKPVVFTLEDGLAKWNYVTTGLENNTEVEIKEGIEAGQTVIVSNNLQLAHDAPVTNH